MSPRPALRAATFWLAGALTAQQVANPPAGNDLARVLASHPFLSKLQLERVEGHTPYLFLFQRVPGAGAQRAPSFVSKLAPLLDATLEVFEQQIARPNALQLRPGHEAFVVIVLASQGDLENYQRVTRTPWHMGVWALHDRELNACVLFEDAYGPERPWTERASSARHVLLHACQQAWYAGAGKVPLESWVFEGMADALAKTAADPGVVRPDPEALRTIVRDAQDAKGSFTYLRNLEELFLVNEASRLEQFYRTRTPKELEPLVTADAWWAFYRQASAFFAYLWSDQNARYRPALVAFLGDALHGLGTAARFQERFVGATASELEHGFLAWLVREHQKAFTVEKFDAERVLRAFARGSPDEQAKPPPPALEVLDASPEERLALALFHLAEGRESAASAALDALASEVNEAALRERVERERRRLTAWRQQRDAYLRSLVGSGTALAFDLDGKSFKAKVVAFEDGQLVLEKNRSGRDRLALEDLDALALAEDMPKSSTDEWARLLPYVLRADSRVKRLLKDDGGESGALLRDALEDYPARLRLGRVMAAFDDMAKQPAGATPAEVEEQLVALRALRSESGDLALVQRKAPALLAHARNLLERKFELLGDTRLLAGKLEVLSGETVRLTYSFDDPRELDDFDPSPYPVLHSKGFEPLKVKDVPFAVVQGELTGRGQATLRSLFELAPPFSVRYGVAFADTGSEVQNPLFLFLGVSDDHAEHFVWGHFQTLQILEKKRSDMVKGEDFPFFLDAVYAMHMRHDGERVFLNCENREVSIAAGQCQKGAIFLHAHSGNPVRVTELVIEGRLLPDSLAGLRKARIERELASF